ncbi:MAG: SDR family NAD(P)-dependent oxidoreductase [Bacteroidota bacterium]
MAKVFITGSSDGLGRMAASLLIEQGHEVTLHARNQQRAKDAMKLVPAAKNCLIGDLSDLEQSKDLAKQANACGRSTRSFTTPVSTMPRRNLSPM